MATLTVREMKDKAKDLIEGVKDLKAKGDDITPEEVGRMTADSVEAKGLLDQIKKTQADTAGEDIGGLDAALKAMTEPRRPGLSGGDAENVSRSHLRDSGWGRVSLGESLVRHEAYKSFNPHVQGATIGIEFGNLPSIFGNTKATFDTAGSTFTQFDRPPGIVLLEQQRLTVADLLAEGTTSANTIRYMREDTYTNAATTVAEGATKPEASFDTSEADAPVRKIAVTAKVTDELYDDFPAMQSYIDGRLRFMVGTTEESQLLNGDGNSPNLRGILQTSGIQTQAKGADTNLDAIHKAITKVRSVGFFEPDAIVMHPTDYQLIRLAKDSNQQYYGGGPFMGQYGQNGYPGLIGPWGLRAVVTTAMTAGTALVGNFKLGAMLFRRMGVTVQMTNSNEDDFKRNLIAIRCEERLAIAVWRPKAFSTITGIA